VFSDSGVANCFISCTHETDLAPIAKNNKNTHKKHVLLDVNVIQYKQAKQVKM